MTVSAVVKGETDERCECYEVEPTATVGAPSLLGVHASGFEAEFHLGRAAPFAQFDRFH